MQINNLINTLPNKILRNTTKFLAKQEQSESLSHVRFVQDTVTNLIPKATFARSFADLSENSFQEVGESVLVYYTPKLLGNGFFRPLYERGLDAAARQKISTPMTELNKDASISAEKLKEIKPIKAAIAASCLIIPLAEYSLCYLKNLFTLKVFHQADFNNIANLNKDKKKMEAADAKFQKFLADAQTKELELLQKYANTYVAAYVVASTMRDVGLDKLRMRYDILGAEAKNTSFGKAIARQIQRYEQVEVGSVAPEFKLQALDNGIVSLHETKAKLKIVNFWASWSAPCRTENVNLLRLYEAYHLRGLEIFSVSIDDNAAAWKKAVNEDGMGEWKNVSDLKGQFSDLMLDFCLQTIPYTFILDEDNVILAKGLRGEELRKKVDELLKRK